MNEKKLFYVIDDGENSITVAPDQLNSILLHGLTEHNAQTPEEDLPVFTVSPVYMTQEEYDNMPEYNG